MECSLYRGGVRDPSVTGLDGVGSLLASDELVWLDVIAPEPGDFTALQAAIPPLVEFDLARLQRLGRPPKTKVFDDVLLVRSYGVLFDEELKTHEIHAIAGASFLVTLRYGPTFDLSPVAARWARAPERGIEGGAFLLAVLLDEIVDDYFDVVDRFEEQADALTDRVFDDQNSTGSKALQERRKALQLEIHRLRGELAKFRREILPFGELRELAQRPAPFVGPAAAEDFRDVADAVLRVIELIDNARDQLTSAFEAQMAQVSNELNQTMKKLSGWAAILLVPTLIAGIYGMNFREMPELRFALGYPMALGLMVVAAFILYRVFKHKDWL
ncbi:MAG: CorA family divalent cation transporter [Actinomycetota bacterium]